MLQTRRLRFAGVSILATYMSSFAACKPASNSSPSPDPGTASANSGGSPGGGGPESPAPAAGPATVNAAKQGTPAAAAAAGPASAATTPGPVQPGASPNSPPLAAATAGSSPALATAPGTGTPAPTALAAPGAPANPANACTPTACLPVSADVLTQLTSTGLLAYIGQSAAWTFRGIDRKSLNPDQQSSGRNVMVVLFDLPPGQVTPDPTAGKLATTATFTWTPTTAATGNLSLLLRDYDRCVLHEGAQTCNQFAYLTDYDSKIDAVPWQVTAAAPTQLQALSSFGQPPTPVAPAATPQPVNSSGIIGGVLQSLLGHMLKVKTSGAGAPPTP